MKTKYNAIHFFKKISSSCKGSILTVSVIVVLSLLYYPVTSMATDLSGNLNAIDTLKLVDSPFTVIANISWTSGTHVIEPGVVLMFDPNTGFEIAQANVKCEGTVSDSIVFTSTGGTLGTWNGVYFSNNSDNGVSSTMSYTRIEKAGNGTWNSNLYCANTIMPNISHSSFVEADGNGIRLNYSPRTMSDCIMELNSTGLNINYPNGTITTYLNSCTLQNNTYSGLRCNTFIELTNSLITNNNIYEVDAFAPNGFPLLINSSILEDATSMNRVGAGVQSVDRIWPYCSNGYEVTGVVYIYLYQSNPRLTIDPGSEIKFATAGKIQVTNSGSSGGELHALGTVDSVITFTALDPGGNWVGIHFDNGSDAWGSSSVMQHCIIEKGNSYNVYCNASNLAVVFNDCEFNNAVGEGLELNLSSVTVNNSLFQNNHTGINNINGSSTTSLTNCTIQNNTNTGLRSNTEVEMTDCLITNNNVYEVNAFAPNGFPLLINSSILEDATSMNKVGAGVQSVDRIWPYCSNGYEVTGVVYIYLYQSNPRLTIDPGSEIKFATAGKIQVTNSGSSGGELHALGTVDSVITFTALDPGGNWVGIHFDNGSDAWGSSSVMQHCIIEKGNSYNVYCYNNYNSVVFDNCEFNNAVGEGLELSLAAVTVNNSLFQNNHTGLSLTSSNSNFITYLNNCTIQNNTNTGIRSNLFIELTNSLITNNNVYEVNAFAPNGFPKLTNSSILEDATSINRVGAGIQSVDRTWPYNSNGYEVTGVVHIYLYQSNPRLTIDPGSEIKFATAGKIQVANSGSYGGELHALGTVDSVITFTALDPGGNWAGIHFDNGSDSWGSSSVMQHCIIEKGNSYNVYCYNNYNSVVFDNCEFNNAVGEGLELSLAAVTVNNSLFQNNHTGLSLTSSNSNFITYLNNCTIQNNTNTGIRSNLFIELTNSLITNNNVYEVNAFAPNGFPKLTNSSILEDATSINRVGAGIQSVDRTWPYNSNGYEVTGLVHIYLYQSNPRLTIDPGSEIKFATAGKIQVANSGSYGGELHALGTVDSVITFTALDPGGNWAGIHFDNGSDSWGSSSVMQHCIIEKGNSYNVYCNASNLAVVFNDCEFNNAVGEGLELSLAAVTVNNSLFQNNHTGINNNNGSSITSLTNCTIQNNTNTGLRSNTEVEMTDCLITNNNVYEVNAFAPNGFPKLTNSSILEDATSINRVGAGIQSVDRTWPYNSNGYEVTGVVHIYLYQSNPRLTIDPGSVIKFATAGKIQVANSGSFGGELHALGTVDSVITFTALDPGGNWVGIHFDNGSDAWGSSSIMQHCIIEKGNAYNVYLNATNQPSVFMDCEISNSAGIGLSLNNSSTSLERCQIINNASYGVYINGNSHITIGNSLSKICDLYYNGMYDVYNNSVNYIPAGSNFWNTADTGLISSRIYDKYDEFLKGIVYHYPIKHVGSIPIDEFNINGKVVYNNVDSTELNGLDITAMDMLGNITGTATTNASGEYSFADLENAYYIFSGSGVAWGGSNSTDALLILQHFAFINPLMGVNLGAADVNGSSSVNGTDALMVLQRFSALINNFPAGDWILSDTATLYGNNLTINQVASCYGDVNGTYTPPGKEVSTITLLADGNMGITSFEEYDIPIKVKNGFDMGALSMVLTFPEEYIEIEDMILANGSTGLIFNVNNGIISNAWANLDPLLFDDDEILLTLKIKTKDLAGLTGNISFGLEAISEIANANAEVIEDIVLTAPELVYGFTSTDEGLDINGLAVSNYPDPFTINTTIEYTLPKDGKVQLQVFNSQGKQEAVLIDEFQIAGNYKINFDRNNLQAGLYFYKLTFISKGNEQTIVKKMIINR